jgi:OmpA-OmpF porin, OOP family
MKQFTPFKAAALTLLLLTSVQGVLAASESKPHVAPGYLGSGFGVPVKNNYGECWMSGPVPNFKPSPDCMTPIESPAVEAAPTPAPAVEAPSVVPEPKVAEPAPIPEPAAPIHMSLSADALFDFDKSKLRPAGMKAIEEALAKTMMEGGPMNVERIMVIGHTDSVGTIPYNQKLSERRANSVKVFMMSKGVPADRIVTEGRGKLDPIATNKTAEGRQLNRRVDITFEGTEPAQQ